MTNIFLESMAKIKKKDLTPQQLNLIKTKFTITNPMFFKLEKMGKPTWATPEHLKFYEETSTEISIPLGGAKDIGTILGTDCEIKDERFENKNKIKINFTATLRDYQQKASDAILGGTIGTIQATTGSGKTVIAINAICERKQPTLFLVNTIELANQFIERLKQFTDLTDDQIGLIGSSSYEIRDVSVGILQTITKLDNDKMKEINNFFGQVFVDEVQK